MRRRPLIIFVGITILISATGCQRVYYGAMEKIGYQKREILVDRVKDARNSQEKAKEQFESALDRFRSVVNVEGGDLERKYDQLNAELQRNERRAQDVHDRIDEVEDVADALFKEWKKELGQYSDASLRRDSERKLDQTRDRYEDLLDAMKRAEARMDPVLQPFRDQVLFLKHNLNAKAIASLQGELGSIQNDVDSLIRDLERSIAEADQFIRTMGAD